MLHFLDLKSRRHNRMELPLVLQEIVDNIKIQYQLPEVKWTTGEPTAEDLYILEREVLQESQFDRVNFRKEMWGMFQRGDAELLCKVSKYGKVLVLKMRDHDLHMSWSLWGRILQGFDTPSTTRICWYAHPQKRELPLKGHLVAAEHVNGGYTIPCRTDAIVIYRLEEATRVLIHELFHASCTDNHDIPIELIEAKTETYAELFLVGYASRGSMSLAKKLWTKQSKWIHQQNATLRNNHGVKTLSDYSARYTMARKDELRDLGISLVAGKGKSNSSRFTCAHLDKYLV